MIEASAFGSTTSYAPAHASWRRRVLHADVVRSIEDAHRGNGYSNAMYIPSAPWCVKNQPYLRRRLPSFMRGESPPDFPTDHCETDFVRSAQESDPLGHAQLGFDLAR